MKSINLARYAFLVLALAFSTSTFAYDPYDCLNDMADIDPEMPIGLATELCSGAWSSEPAKCYLTIPLIDNIPRGIAIDLCAGTTNAEKTLECYAKSGDRDLNRGLATTLCGNNKIEN